MLSFPFGARIAVYLELSERS
ncbi:MAG: hypothetical protein QOH78_331, partial [Verrucomicrobiota bacterium]